MNSGGSGGVADDDGGGRGGQGGNGGYGVCSDVTKAMKQRGQHRLQQGTTFPLSGFDLESCPCRQFKNFSDAILGPGGTL